MKLQWRHLSLKKKKNSTEVIMFIYYKTYLMTEALFIPVIVMTAILIGITITFIALFRFSKASDNPNKWLLQGISLILAVIFFILTCFFGFSLITTIINYDELVRRDYDSMNKEYIPISNHTIPDLSAPFQSWNIKILPQIK